MREREREIERVSEKRINTGGEEMQNRIYIKERKVVFFPHLERQGDVLHDASSQQRKKKNSCTRKKEEKGGYRVAKKEIKEERKKTKINLIKM